MTIFAFPFYLIFILCPAYTQAPADGGCVERPLKQYCEANEQKLGGAVSRGKKLANLEMFQLL
jgi:hypothetical protein